VNNLNTIEAKVKMKLYPKKITINNKKKLYLLNNLSALFPLVKKNKIFDPSNGGIGIKLNIPHTQLIKTIKETKLTTELLNPIK